MENIMLSIYVATYNHEKYITKALDSILMQKTDYSYEVWVGEDCSPDSTREVLKEYEKLHPGKFNILYRSHNMHKDPIGNAGDLKSRCRGKYIIALEGDDYWTDEYKIDKQIRFLEEHPEYIAIAHDCTVVDAQSREKDEQYPRCKQQEYTFRHLVSELMPGQLATVMYRNYIIDDKMDVSIFQERCTPGDRKLYFFLLSNGRIFCSPEKMSAYRHVTDTGTSFSANYSYNFNSWDKLYSCFLNYAKKIKNDEAIKYAEFLYLKNVIKGKNSKQFSGSVLEKISNVDHKCRSSVMYIKYNINYKLRHKELWL